jgi:DUF917 family protein
MTTFNVAGDPKLVEIHLDEKGRRVILRTINQKSGLVESDVVFTAEEAAHHTRAMFQICKKIKATGTHLVLPGDVEFRTH